MTHRHSEKAIALPSLEGNVGMEPSMGSSLHSRSRAVSSLALPAVIQGDPQHLAGVLARRVRPALCREEEEGGHHVQEGLRGASLERCTEFRTREKRRKLKFQELLTVATIRGVYTRWNVTWP